MNENSLDINGWIAIMIGIVTSGFGFFIKLWMGRVDADIGALQISNAAFVPRLVKVETQSEGMIMRLDRIEGKIDSLIDKLPNRQHESF